MRSANLSICSGILSRRGAKPQAPLLYLKHMHPEIQYLKLMAEILRDGKTKPTRGIHPVKAIFGYQMHFDLRQGFPMLTTKKMPFKTMLRELLWFVSGSSNIKYLQDHNIR